MPNINWSEEKNNLLKTTRDVGFEEVRKIIKLKHVLADIPHHNQDKYPNQRIFILKIHEYVYLVPYIKVKSGIFLKTIYPNSKLNKKYTGGLNDKSESK